MFDVKSILSFLRDYELDRQSVQFLHDELARLTEMKTELPASSQGALDEEYGQLQARLLVMSNRVSRIERLLSNLTPEEQLVVDKMILHPYKNCTFDLMEQLDSWSASAPPFTNSAPERSKSSAGCISA